MPIRAQAYRERYLHRCLSSRATFSAATITRVSFHRMHAIMRGEGIERRWLYCAILFVDQSGCCSRVLKSFSQKYRQVLSNRPVAGDDVMRKKASNWGNREFAASMSPGANSSASRTTMSQRSPPSRNSTRMRLLFARRGARSPRALACEMRDNEPSHGPQRHDLRRCAHPSGRDTRQHSLMRGHFQRPRNATVLCESGRGVMSLESQPSLNSPLIIAVGICKAMHARIVLATRKAGSPAPQAQRRIDAGARQGEKPSGSRAS